MIFQDSNKTKKKILIIVKSSSAKINLPSISFYINNQINNAESDNLQR